MTGALVSVTAPAPSGLDRMALHGQSRRYFYFREPAAGRVSRSRHHAPVCASQKEKIQLDGGGKRDIEVHPDNRGRSAPAGGFKR